MANIKLWLARTVIAFFSVFSLVSGIFVAGVAFHDTDTCWLLALGRWIFENHRLPLVDPLSTGIGAYATLWPGAPPIQYQWLAEVFFYIVFLVSGLVGLLFLTAWMLYATYFAIPMVLMDRVKIMRWASVLLVFLSVVLAGSRFLCRPQIFSFCFLSFLLNVLVGRNFADKATLRRQAFVLFPLLLLWTNLHVFFPLGIAIVGAFSAFRLAELFFFRRSELTPQVAGWLIALPVIACVPTLVNPWGFHLWLFFLRILHSPINVYVAENGPMSWTDPSAILLLLLSLGCLIYTARVFMRIGWRSGPLISIPMILYAAYIPLGHARLISLSPLILIGAIAEAAYYAEKAVPNHVEQKIDSTKPTFEQLLSNMMTPLKTFLVINFVLISLGVSAEISLLPTRLPDGSSGFIPPFKAIEFLKAHRPPGRVINDPGFGSVMDWYLASPDVFIDTRFSFFDEERIVDYQNMSFANPNWRTTFDKYGFNWAFLPPDKPLARELQKLHWRILFQDSTAIILEKPAK